MTCMQTRHAISARLDGEDPGLDDAAVYSHLAGCAGCRAFAHDAESFHRFFESQTEIPGIMEAAGAQGAPQISFYRKLDMPDEF